MVSDIWKLWFLKTQKNPQTTNDFSKSFPGGTSGKEPICQRRRHRDTGIIPRSGRSAGEGNSNSL